MVQTALSEIQAAIYATLVPNGTLDTVLASLGVTGVFDMRAVPESQPFDYITIGDTTETPNNTFGRRGYNNTITIHIWSRALGTKNAARILARLNQLLDQQTLALATQAHIYTMYNTSIVTDGGDGLTLHIPVRYNIFTQE